MSFFPFKFAACLLVTTLDAHIQICLLKKRHDESTGRMRWSMASIMRCQCDRVMISLVDNTPYCPKVLEDTMWFTDNQDELKHKSNWTPDRLDALLERKIFCGKHCFKIFCYSSCFNNSIFILII